MNNEFHMALKGIKPYLVTSNGERLMVKKHCEKRLPLKCHSFREKSNIPWIWFQDVRFRTWGLEINHLNAHNFVWQGWFFCLLLSRKFDDRLSSNFHRFVILCICWDTPTVKASLWQLPIVSTAFNEVTHFCLTGLHLPSIIICMLIILFKISQASVLSLTTTTLNAIIVSVNCVCIAMVVKAISKRYTNPVG